ncbi:MAG: hypothetical protein ABW178_11235 [Pseudoxanthomonas sp.]
MYRFALLALHALGAVARLAIACDARAQSSDFDRVKIQADDKSACC